MKTGKFICNRPMEGDRMYKVGDKRELSLTSAKKLCDSNAISPADNATAESMKEIFGKSYDVSKKASDEKAAAKKAADEKAAAKKAAAKKAADEKAAAKKAAAKKAADEKAEEASKNKADTAAKNK